MGGLSAVMAQVVGLGAKVGQVETEARCEATALLLTEITKRAFTERVHAFWCRRPTCVACLHTPYTPCNHQGRSQQTEITSNRLDGRSQ